MTTRQEFGALEMAAHGETAGTVMAAQAQAAVQARYVMALRRPRDIDDVRVRILNDSKRPSFAKIARYDKPISGKHIRGLSIKFMESFAQAYGNIYVDTPTIYDDAEKRIVRVVVSDLETNVTYQKDIAIAKTVERLQPREGQTVLRSRTNSVGKTTYLVEATEDDLLVKEGGLVSRVLRKIYERLLPKDIQEECEAQVIETQQDEDAKDPGAARKAIADAFAELAVKPSDLKVYLDHDLDNSSPAELGELRGIYTAIKEGTATWREVLAAKTGGEEGEAEKKGESAANAALKAKLSAKVANGKPATPDAPAGPTLSKIEKKRLEELKAQAAALKAKEAAPKTVEFEAPPPSNEMEGPPIDDLQAELLPPERPGVRR
jgi:hypothetical protein